MSSVLTEKPAEEKATHTRILRFQLGPEESRAYWERVEDMHAQRSSLEAFNGQWFGAISENRTKVVMGEMRARYDAFPAALGVLSRWRGMTPATRTLICHWHLQLADPLYRAFTGEYLEERRESFKPEVEREDVIRWVALQEPERWGRRTLVAFGSKLLTAAYSVGLVETKRDPRPLLYPRVTDEALAYMMHLLQEVDYQGSILENPYLRSVGLSGKFLEDRLRTLPGAELHRMGDLVEFKTAAPDLKSWSTTSLGLSEAR